MRTTLNRLIGIVLALYNVTISVVEVQCSLVASTTVNYDHIFKIILIGDNSVGKSSFIRRFCEGTFVADMESTIGVDFYLNGGVQAPHH